MTMTGARVDLGRVRTPAAGTPRTAAVTSASTQDEDDRVLDRLAHHEVQLPEPVAEDRDEVRGRHADHEDHTPSGRTATSKIGALVVLGVAEQLEDGSASHARGTRCRRPRRRSASHRIRWRSSPVARRNRLPDRDDGRAGRREGDHGSHADQRRRPRRRTRRRRTGSRTGCRRPTQLLSGPGRTGRPRCDSATPPRSPRPPIATGGSADVPSGYSRNSRGSSATGRARTRRRSPTHRARARGARHPRSVDDHRLREREQRERQPETTNSHPAQFDGCRDR